MDILFIQDTLLFVIRGLSKLLPNHPCQAAVALQEEERICQDAHAFKYLIHHQLD